MMVEIVVLQPRQRPAPTREDRALLWEGIVRLMEANDKRSFEIGLSDAREIALVMREAANGRQ